MKKIALSLVLLAGLAMANEANATDANATKAEANATAAGNAEKGKALYAKCVSCHGADGKMKALGKSAPIAGWEPAKTLEALKGYQAGSRNVYGMGGLMKTQVAGMSEQDLQDLAAYIATLK